MADGRLGQLERVVEVARTRLAALVRGVLLAELDTLAGRAG
jgi:hypothetical protein